eukprot:6634078-Heterocapsa_arctica.AAC.1
MAGKSDAKTHCNINTTAPPPAAPQGPPAGHWGYGCCYVFASCWPAMCSKPHGAALHPSI